MPDFSKATKAPRRLVTEISQVYGYRGAPSVYLLLACGHHTWLTGKYLWEVKLTAGKSKVQCWDCYRVKHNIRPLREQEDA